jgi:hypothetical protein
VSELTTGAAISVVGEVVASQGKGQSIEVRASSVELVGACPAETFPLQKKRHSLEFLRGIAHLRPRTNLLGAVARVRSELAQATHAFFASQGFRCLAGPLEASAPQPPPAALHLLQYPRLTPTTRLRQVPPIAGHHGVRLRGCRRDVPGNHSARRPPGRGGRGGRGRRLFREVRLPNRVGPGTFPVPSLYLPCTFPVPSLYLPLPLGASLPPT